MGRCSHTFPHSVDSSGLKFSSVYLPDADVKPKKPKKVDEDTPAAAVRTVYVCMRMHARMYACMHVPVLWISQNQHISRAWITLADASRNPLVSPQAPKVPKGADADLPMNGEVPLAWL
jgi:hypothetical protein